jgi:hypothetical protein
VTGTPDTRTCGSVARHSGQPSCALPVDQARVGSGAWSAARSETGGRCSASGAAARGPVGRYANATGLLPQSGHTQPASRAPVGNRRGINSPLSGRAERRVGGGVARFAIPDRQVARNVLCAPSDPGDRTVNAARWQIANRLCCKAASEVSYDRADQNHVGRTDQDSRQASCACRPTDMEVPPECKLLLPAVRLPVARVSKPHHPPQSKSTPLLGFTTPGLACGVTSTSFWRPPSSYLAFSFLLPSFSSPPPSSCRPSSSRSSRPWPPAASLLLPSSPC